MYDAKKTYGRKLFQGIVIAEMAKDYVTKMETKIKEITERELQEATIKKNSGSISKKRF